jgi:6-phosphogluconolactonase
MVAHDAAGAAREAAQLLAAAARRGGHVALSGGSTPRPAYELAASLEPDWAGVDLWLVDERCVPPADERSNLRLVRESLVDRVARPPRLHPVRTELPPADAAADYAGALRGTTLALVLLGLGADGHTASLFPDAPSLDEDEAPAVAAPAALSPWVDRVTMTIRRCRGGRVVFLAVGADKAPAARARLRRASSRKTRPRWSSSTHGRTIVVSTRRRRRLHA